MRAPRGAGTAHRPHATPQKAVGAGSAAAGAGLRGGPGCTQAPRVGGGQPQAGAKHRHEAGALGRDGVHPGQRLYFNGRGGRYPQSPQTPEPPRPPHGPRRGRGAHPGRSGPSASLRARPRPRPLLLVGPGHTAPAWAALQQPPRGRAARSAHLPRRGGSDPRRDAGAAPPPRPPPAAYLPRHRPGRSARGAHSGAGLLRFPSVHVPQDDVTSPA